MTDYDARLVTTEVEVDGEMTTVKEWVKVPLSPEEQAAHDQKKADAAAARFDQLKAEVLAHAEAVGQAFLAGYPEVEQKSFPEKKAEALAIVAGETDPANFPLIAEETGLTGKSASESAARILQNAGLMTRVAGAISGFRQRAENDIAEAADYDAARAAVDGAKALLSASIAAITSG